MSPGLIACFDHKENNKNNNNREHNINRQQLPWPGAEQPMPLMRLLLPFHCQRMASSISHNNINHNLLMLVAVP